MKDMTFDEMWAAPAIIQFIWGMSINGSAIGMGLYKKAMKDHPEYFPDEIEAQRKWAAIPKSVHDAYWAEREALREPSEIGLIASIELLSEDPAKYKEWADKNEQTRAARDKQLKALHDKHYGPYGVKWHGC